jgi:hypothetical protein
MDMMSSWTKYVSTCLLEFFQIVDIHGRAARAEQKPHESFLEAPSSNSYPPKVKGTFIFFTQNLVNLFNSKS